MDNIKSLCSFSFIRFDLLPSISCCSILKVCGVETDINAEREAWVQHDSRADGTAKDQRANKMFFGEDKGEQGNME